MPAEEKALDQIKEMIIHCKAEEVERLVTSCIDRIDPIEIIEKAMSPAMHIIGERFESGEVYLPEMIGAATAFEKAMSILKPIILQSGRSIKKTGKVVIGTVKTDIHEIGKNIVASMLATAGFEIWDLRADVSALDFIKKAEEVNADTIALSALMTTTMPYQKDVIDLLANMSLRHKYRVVVGGGAVNQEWANRICADGYAENAPGAVRVIEDLLKE